MDKEPKIELIPLRSALASDRVTNLDLLVRITTPEPDNLQSRPPLNLGMVIDRSGSMQGAKLQRARQAAAFAVEQLREGDRVAITVFDDYVRTIVPSRLADDRDAILREIRRISAGSSTALHAGWLEGALQVSQYQRPECLNRVILLSDGLANVGETNADRIASDVRGLTGKGVSTTAMGIGDDYDEDLMAAMAAAGDGNFCHIESPEQLPGFFKAELQGLAATVGHRVSLGIEPLGETTVSDVLNDLEKTEFGRLKLGNLILGLPTQVAVRLKVPPAGQPCDVVRFRLAWDDPDSRRRHVVHATLNLPVLPGVEVDQLPAAKEVEEQFTLLMASRARQEAIRSIDRGDFQGARRLFQQTARDLSSLPQSGEALAEIAALEDLQEDLESGRSAAARKKAAYQSFQRRMSRGKTE